MSIAPIICRLSEECIEALVDIDGESGDPPWTQALFQGEFKSGKSHLFGARLEGQLVAFLVCQVVLDEAHIMNVAVRRRFRRRGVGKTLLTHVLGELGGMSVASVFLEVRIGNRAARSLYESLGFSESAVRKKYYRSNDEDGIVMRLDLKDFMSQHHGPAHV